MTAKDQGIVFLAGCIMAICQWSCPDQTLGFWVGSVIAFAYATFLTIRLR